MNYARKVDANHKQIADALRRVGFEVVDFSSMGRGVPDLWACKAGRAVWVEVKDGSKSPSRQKLTEAQSHFREKCERQGIEVVTVTSVEDAVRL